MSNETDENFKKDLTSLLNRYSWDNACETPDYILADYLEKCLTVYCATIARNIVWHSNWKRSLEKIREEDKID